MAVSSNSTALPARKSVGRRTLLRGAVAFPAVALLPAAAPAQFRTDIAKRVHALAGEMSQLLAELDGAMWEVRVSPTFRGAPMFSVEPGALSDEARLNQGLTVALGALNRMRPSRWRKEICLKPGHGFVLLVDDGPHLEAGEGVAWTI